MNRGLWLAVAVTAYLPATALAAAASASARTADLSQCLTIEDGTKERLDCYDTVVPPRPMRTKNVAKTVQDCRHLAQEDKRLTCFNRFAAGSAGRRGTSEPAQAKAPAENAIAGGTQRPAPSVSFARRAIARAIASAGMLGKIPVNGINANKPFKDARIAGPVPHTDFLSRVDSDAYCLKFTLEGGVLGLMDATVDTVAYVRQNGPRVSVRVRSPNSINLVRCPPQLGSFPELEAYNAQRAAQAR
jgi:hypothetical protein